MFCIYTKHQNLLVDQAEVDIVKKIFEKLEILWLFNVNVNLNIWDNENVKTGNATAILIVHIVYCY